MKTNRSTGFKIGLAGRFQVHAWKTDSDGNLIPESKKLKADWFDNIITNQGLNRIGNNAGSGVYPSCQVGSGSATPANTDTALSSHVAGTSTTVSAGPSSGAQSSAPYYSWNRTTWRFGAGDAAGNLAEVGVGWGTSGSTLFSRALILDGGGSPTTITILSDEILDVTYELRQYPVLTDSTGSIVLDSITYNYTFRAANVTAWNNSQLQGYGSYFGWSLTAYDGNMNAAITGSPSGTSDGGGGPVITAYVSNSYEQKVSNTFDIDHANFVTGIKSILLSSGALGQWQMEFDTAIPKVVGEELILVTKLVWARKTL